jgi:hypothetical protein
MIERALNYEDGCNIVAAMNAKPARAKTPLTAEEFGNLLLWLSPDAETATKIFLEISKELRKWFVRKGSAHAEELVDETVDRVARIVFREPDKYSNSMALFRGVARKVWLEDLRKPPQEELAPERIIGPQQEDWNFKECEEKCMEERVNNLPERERDLITQYHRFQGREKIVVRTRLAEDYGGAKNLRTITCRIRMRLKDGVDDCIEKCMNRGQSTETR